MVALVSLTATAQDDMYFVPTKSNVDKSASSYGIPERTYYSGSRRDVDEYNRMNRYRDMRSTAQAIDSVGNDIIDFDAVAGAYPDSAAMHDYQCTKRMSRFDDYDWWDGYYAGLSSYRWGYYDPWYYPWYDSWYGWGYGWPYYYSSWYWDYPGYYWGGWYAPHHHVYYGGGYAGRPYVGRGFTSRDFRGTRGTSAAISRFGTRGSFSNTRGGTSRGTFSGSRGTTHNRVASSRNYGQSRSYSNSSSSFGSSHSSGSFSGSRGGGFSGGGTRGGGFSGGGSHGGRR